ncbi:hypothetical protein [Parabacteroides goldsteinii]|uniref:hypothetical protein n=2 Tax=Parabacteroides goldsteinii TaxID=328812 RepID=UPI003994371B
MLQHSPPFSSLCGIKIKHMIGMQHIDDRNTAVPDWFVGYYDSGYFWVGVAVLSLLTIGLIVLACWLYFEMKEAQRILDEHEKK